jgi:hypothetical protein
MLGVSNGAPLNEISAHPRSSTRKIITLGFDSASTLKTNKVRVNKNVCSNVFIKKAFF